MASPSWPPRWQLLAKDILKFHAVIWPALLMSADLPLPQRLFVHGYILKGGERLSKTTGNIVDPFPYIERYGLDHQQLASRIAAEALDSGKARTLLESWIAMAA